MGYFDHNVKHKLLKNFQKYPTFYHFFLIEHKLQCISIERDSKI